MQCYAVGSLAIHLQAPYGLAFLAEFKIGLDDKAQPQALRYFEQLWEETWPEVLNQSFAATFVIEMMGAGLRCLCICQILLGASTMPCLYLQSAMLFEELWTSNPLAVTVTVAAR